MKLAAKAPTLNMIVSELALDLSRLEYELDIVTHIPGVTNIVADAFQDGTRVATLTYRSDCLQIVLELCVIA